MWYAPCEVMMKSNPTDRNVNYNSPKITKTIMVSCGQGDGMESGKKNIVIIYKHRSSFPFWINLDLNRHTGAFRLYCR